MRTVQFTEYGSPEVVQVAEVPDPHAGPGEVRIAVRASGVATGDVRIRSGALRDAVPVPFPYRTGFDAAGVVDEVGDGVTGVAPGDEVFGMVAAAARGANAERAVLAAWAPRPPTWTWEEAGGAGGSVETAVRVLDRLELRAGATVLVQGASGATGAVVVQVAVARGATVVGTASAGNRDVVRSLGATPTTYGPGLADRVRDLAPAGVDAVVDCAGGDLPELVAIAGDPARVVTIADLGAAAHGVHLSHSAPVAGGGDPFAVQALPLAVALAAEGRLRIPVAAAVPLADAAEAHRLSEGGHAPGRIVLVP